LQEDERFSSDDRLQAVVENLKWETDLLRQDEEEVSDLQQVVMLLDRETLQPDREFRDILRELRLIQDGDEAELLMVARTEMGLASHDARSAIDRQLRDSVTPFGRGLSIRRPSAGFSSDPQAALERHLARRDAPFGRGLLSRSISSEPASAVSARNYSGQSEMQAEDGELANGVTGAAGLEDEPVVRHGPLPDSYFLMSSVHTSAV
jgi:hypothetical protein